MRRKFQLIDFVSPYNLTLTEAKKVIGNKINNLEIGHQIKFMGYGNGINFTIQRMK